MVDGPLCRRWSIYDCTCNCNLIKSFKLLSQAQVLLTGLSGCFSIVPITIMMSAVRDKFLAEYNGPLWRMKLLRKAFIQAQSTSGRVIHLISVGELEPTRHRLLIKLRAHQTIYRKWLVTGQHSWAQQRHFLCVHPRMPGNMYPLCHYLWRWRTQELQSRRHSRDTVRTCCRRRHRRQKQ